MSTVRFDRRRWAVALALAGCGAAASYAFQHLYARWGAPADFAMPVAGAPIPFFWRAALMVLHGSLLGTLAFVGFSNDTCARLLEQIPLLVAVVVLPLAAAMVVFP